MKYTSHSDSTSVYSVEGCKTATSIPFFYFARKPSQNKEKKMLFHLCTGVDSILQLAAVLLHDVQAVALHQSPAAVFHSCDQLQLAVLWYLPVKAIGAVWKQQHIAEQVPATMHC